MNNNIKENKKIINKFLEENKNIIGFEYEGFVYLKTIKYIDKNEEKQYRVILSVDLDDILMEIVQISNEKRYESDRMEYTYRQFKDKEEKEKEEENIIKRKIDKKNNKVEEYGVEKGENKEIILEGENIIEKIICSFLYIEDLREKLNIIKDVIILYN